MDCLQWLVFASGADLLQTRKCRLSEADFCTNNKFPIGNYLKNSPWFMSHSLTPFYYCATIPKIFQEAICGYWQDITFIGGGKNMEWIDRQSFHCIQPWEIVFLHWLLWQRWWSGSPDLVGEQHWPGDARAPPSCHRILTWALPGDTGILLTGPGLEQLLMDRLAIIPSRLCSTVQSRLSYPAQQTSWNWNHDASFLVEHWRWGRPPL